MSDLRPITKCPNCGGTTLEASAITEAHLNDEIACPGCGHRAAKHEFLAETVDEAVKLAQDMFRNVPGFKPK